MFISNWEQVTFASGVPYVINEVILDIDFKSTTPCISKI